MSQNKAEVKSHQAPAVFGFLAVPWSATSTGGSHGPQIKLGFDIGQILDPGPQKIGAPVTPGVSLGTKIFVSKIFSYHPKMMLFYEFC